MKKIIAIFAISCLFAATSSAQSVYTMTKNYNGTATVDTSKGTGTAHVDLVTTLPGLTCAGFQVVVTRISTAMAGTVALQGSNDGTNYVATAAADTFHVTDGATSIGKIVIPPATGILYHYYRLSLPGTASDTCTLKGYAQFRTNH